MRTLLAGITIGIIVSCATASNGTADVRLRRVLSSGLNQYGVRAAEDTDLAGTPFHVSLMERPSTLPAEEYVTAPLLAAPVCLGYKLPMAAALVFDLGSLGAALLDGTAFGMTRVGTPVNSADVTFVLGDPGTSASSAVLLSALVRTGVAGYTDATAWPPGVLANSQVVMALSDVEVAALVQSGERRLGPMPLAAAEGVPCSRLVVENAYSGDRKTDTAYLTPQIGGFLSLSQSGGDLVINVSPNTTEYPLVGALVLSLRRRSSCEELQQAMALAVHALGDREFQAPLLQWGFGVLEVKQEAEAFRWLLDSHEFHVVCRTPHAVPAGGSATVQQATLAWTAKYALDHPVFIDYVADGSAQGLAGVLEGSKRVAMTDAMPSAEERAAHPAVQLAPALAFAVSIVYHLDGVERLVLPRCVVVALFKGELTWWDDPLLQEANPSVVLPHEPVVMAARGTASGTTEVFTAGLRAMEEACAPEDSEHSPTVKVGRTWSLPATVTVDTVDAVEDIIRHIEGSIAVVPASTAGAHGLHEAALQNDSSGSIISSAGGFVEAVVATATVNNTTGEVSFVRTAESYPFVGFTYAVFDGAAPAFCSETKEALEWLMFGALTAEGHELSRDGLLTPVSEALQARMRAVVGQARCRGALLFPGLEDDGISSAVLWSAAGVSVVLCALVAVAGFRLRQSKRSAMCAPKDESLPYTMVFTDIQASTALWAALPELMGQAIDQHHYVIRGLISKYNGYEVKTIGDSFMVAFKQAADGVGFALEVQTALHAAEWPLAVDHVYEEQLARAHGVAAAAGMTGTAAWRGLRVRVGVHTGRGEIRLDAVSGTYDYYGSVVNTAARIESVSHGGQVCVSGTARLAAGVEVAVAFEEKPLGAQELRGLDEAVELVQLVPCALVGRRFPKLRLEKAETVTEQIDASASLIKSTDVGSGHQTDSRDGSLGYDEAGAVEHLAAALCPANGLLRPLEVVRHHRFLSSLVAPLGKKQRGQLLKELRQAWRVEDAPRGASAEKYATLKGEKYGTVVLAHRAGAAMRMAEEAGRREGRLTRGDAGTSGTELQYIASNASGIESIRASPVGSATPPQFDSFIASDCG